MRNFRALTVLGLLTIVTLMMVLYTGCTDNSKPKEPANDQVTEQTPPVPENIPAAVTFAYACPMHPEQGSDDPNGVCQICGMNFQSTAKVEEVAQTYACPMHPEQTSTDPNAVCPICSMKMELVKEEIEDQTEPGEDVAGTENETGETETGDTETGETEPDGSETETGE